MSSLPPLTGVHIKDYAYGYPTKKPRILIQFLSNPEDRPFRDVYTVKVNDQTIAYLQTSIPVNNQRERNNRVFQLLKMIAVGKETEQFVYSQQAKKLTVLRSWPTTDPRSVTLIIMAMLPVSALSGYLKMLDCVVARTSSPKTQSLVYKASDFLMSAAIMPYNILGYFLLTLAHLPGLKSKFFKTPLCSLQQAMPAIQHYLWQENEHLKKMEMINQEEQHPPEA